MGCLQCCLIFHCKVLILPSTGYGDCFVSLVLRMPLAEPYHPEPGSKNPPTLIYERQGYGQSTKCRSSLQVDLRSLGTGWSPWQSSRPTDDRSLFASYLQQHQTWHHTGRIQWALWVAFNAVLWDSLFPALMTGSIQPYDPIGHKKTAMTIWETTGKHRPLCERISGHT